MTTQFDGLADVYARARPGYPLMAMQWILSELERGDPANPVRVADIGCGTGIATEMLHRAAASLNPALALRIEGVEPGADMRAKAAARAGVFAHLHATRAEATGLPSRTFDLVLVAQAFHWFDAHAALVEFHRILRPGGVLALVWNLRQQGVDALTDAYNRIVDPQARLDPLQASRRAELAAPLRESPLFSALRERDFDNPQPVTEASLVERATSASYFPRGEPERSQAIEALHDAWRRHAREGAAALHQRCHVTLASA